MVQRVQRANAQIENPGFARYDSAQAIEAGGHEEREDQQQQYDRQASRYPVSFEVSNEWTTDVRQDTADKSRHDQAPQCPYQVRCQKNSSGRDDTLDHDGGRLRACGACHGLPSSHSSDSLKTSESISIWSLMAITLASLTRTLFASTGKLTVKASRSDLPRASNDTGPRARTENQRITPVPIAAGSSKEAGGSSSASGSSLPSAAPLTTSTTPRRTINSVAAGLPC